MLFSIENYFFFFLLYSVLGWVYETVLCSVRERSFVNRGFLNGPYCPIYGVGAVLFLLFLGNEKSSLLIFVFGSIIATAVEYFTSFVMEKTFGARWWDYSAFKFNLNGRVCLGASAIFGAFAVALIKIFHPAVLDFTKSVPNVIFHWVNSVSAAAFICDLALTLRGSHSLGKRLRDITEMLTSALSENEQEKAKNLLFDTKISRQHTRLLRAFPNMSSPKYSIALENVRSNVNKNKKAIAKNPKR
jgi:uncharacterized membrane protein